MGTVKSLHDRLRQDEAVKEQRPCVWLRYPHTPTPSHPGQQLRASNQT